MLSERAVRTPFRTNSREKKNRNSIAVCARSYSKKETTPCLPAIRRFVFVDRLSFKDKTSACLEVAPATNSTNLLSVLFRIQAK